VYRLDRLSRSALDLLDISNHLQAKGVQLHSICESIDTSTAVGKLFYGFLALFAEFERNRTVERTKEALDYKRDNGEWVGRVPFGWTLANGGLVENIEEQKRIEQARMLREKGESWRYISRVLNVDKMTIKRAVERG